MKLIDVVLFFKIPFYCVTKNVKKGIFTYDILPDGTFDYHRDPIEKYIKENPSEINPERVEKEVAKRREKNREYTRLDKNYNAKKRAKYFRNRESVLTRQKNNYHNNKEEKKAKQKEYRKKETSKIAQRKRVKKHREKNIEKTREQARRYSKTERSKNNREEWRKNNKESISKKRSERKKNDAIYKLKTVLRRGLLYAIKGKAKKNSAINLLGISVENFKKYISDKFKLEMSWDNHGGYWHLDHFIACNCWDLNRTEAQEKCFHYTNYQPLTVKENLEKQDKIPLDVLLGLDENIISLLKPKWQKLYYQNKPKQLASA